MKSPAYSQFFEAVPVRDHIMQILGQGGELCYLIEGTERAVLIDGLVGAGSLKNYVREMTDLPVTLILTHGHLDHTGAAWEYGSCYIHPDDIALLYSPRHCSVKSRFEFARMEGPLCTHQADSLCEADIIHILCMTEIRLILAVSLLRQSVFPDIRSAHLYSLTAETEFSSAETHAISIPCWACRDVRRLKHIWTAFII